MYYTLSKLSIQSLHQNRVYRILLPVEEFSKSLNLEIEYIIVEYFSPILYRCVSRNIIAINSYQNLASHRTSLVEEIYEAI